MDKRSVYILLIIPLLVLTSWVQSGKHIQLAVQPESKLWLQGTSTLHDYSFTASEISGTIEIDSASIAKDLTELKNLFSQVEIMIPVKTIKSGNSSMDDNMYETLKAEEYPKILYRLVESGIVADSSRGNKETTIKTKGRLTVAGKENVIEMIVTLTKSENGNIRVRGSKELLMTDFNIKPPTFMLGVLKTDNRVVVTFDLLLSTQKTKQ